MKITEDSDQRVKTKDLWQSAFMLACGCDLVDVELKTKEYQARKPEVFFTLSGVNAEELSVLFQSGQASCHVGILRGSMMHLKEEMYRIIRR